jgi:beta-lactam-binding protein with PASTA domain
MTTLAELRAKLADQGITLTVIRAFHATVRKGIVYRQDPPKNTILRSGMTLTLWISKGKKPG